MQNDGIRKAGVMYHQADSEGAGDQYAMLVKGPPCGRA